MRITIFILLVAIIATEKAAAQVNSKKQPKAGAENNASVFIEVRDRQTGEPLEGVEVTAKELRFEAKPTGLNGVVAFNNLPAGEARYKAFKKGYVVVDTVFTASAREQDNSYNIYMNRLNPLRNRLFINGTVDDGKGNLLKDATVSVEMGSFTTSVKSNETGSYRLEVELDKVLYNVAGLTITAQKAGCTERLTLPRPMESAVGQNIQIRCDDEVVEIADNSKSKSAGRLGNGREDYEKTGGTVQEMNGVSIKFLSARYINGWVQVLFFVENISDEYDEINFQVQRHNGGKVIGTGMEYIYQTSSIAGSHNDWDSETVLYKKVPVKVTVNYSGENKPKMNMISVLTQPLLINMQPVTLKLTNIKYTN